MKQVLGVMIQWYMVWLIAIAILLTSCVPPPTVRPETPRQTYVAMEYQFIGAVQTATTLREQKVIDDKMHAELSELFNETELVMDNINLLFRLGDTEEAETKMEEVNLLLWEIRRILMEAQDD